MTETNTHDRDLRRFHEALKMIDRVLAMSWITWSVGDENAIEMMRYFVNGIIIGEARNTCSSANKTSEDVLFDAAIYDCHVEISIAGTYMKGLLGAYLTDEIDLFGVDKGFVLVCVVFLSNGDSSKR